MPSVIALWKDGSRKTDDEMASKIYNNKGGDQLQDMTDILELMDEVDFIVKKNNYVEFNSESDEFYNMAMIFALENDLLMYDANRKAVMCNMGRYGSAETVIYHENMRLVNNPPAEIIRKELEMVDGSTNSFAVLETGSGFIYAFLDNGVYSIELNNGSLEEHYILDEENITLDTAVDLFNQFLTQDLKLSDRNWQTAEFEDDDYDDMDHHHDGHSCCGGHNHGHDHGCGHDHDHDCGCGKNKK